MALLPDYQLTGEFNKLPPRWSEPILRPHPCQSAMWRTNSRFLVAVAGRGSGKTEIARRYITRWLPVRKPWSDAKYVYALPTYKQAKRVVWPDLQALIPKHWLEKNGANASELTFKTKFGSTLFIVGLDNPSRIEGIQIDGCILDECSDQKPTAFPRTILPMLTHRKGWCWQIGVPKRTGPGASKFRQYFEKGQKHEGGYESYTWRSDTVLTEEELSEILEKLDQKDADEQLGGVWVEASGMVYHAFNEMYNLSDKAIYRPELTIGVGSDFNVNPMAWIMFHIIEGKMYVFDEIWQRDTNTPKTLDMLHARYANHRSGWHFFGDASGKNRHTSTATTDYIHILNDARFMNLNRGEMQKVWYPAANPRIHDRYSAVNAMLRNAKGTVRLFIHPKCEKLREDLESRTYKEGTREADDTNLDSGHITDALGYPIHRLFAVRIESDDTGKVFMGGSAA